MSPGMCHEIDILLVHGAWHGAWCWSPLIAALGERGVRATAIDLPGHGGRIAETATWDGYAEAVRDAAAHFATPPLVVGHSMGGGVTGSAAELAPEAIAALVYVCAFLPIDGESLLELSQRAPPIDGLAFLPETDEIALEPGAAERIFFHDCPDGADWAAKTQPQRLAPTTQVVRLTPGRSAAVPRYYVRCSKDRAIPIELQTFMMERVPMRQSFDLDTGHSPFLAATERLADILVEIRNDVATYARDV